jgi:regulator of replication initiation timing
MDIASISSAYTGIKMVKESISALMSLKIEKSAKERINEVLDKLGAIQDTLFYLREELARLQTENAKLKDQLADKEAWENKITEYELDKTEGGAVVYCFKGEPRHYACPSCVNRKEIHILQDRRVVAGTFDCPGCGKKFPVSPIKRKAATLTTLG